MSFSRFSFLLAAAAILTGCGKTERTKSAEASSKATPVSVAKAVIAVVPVEIESTGTVRARVTTTLSARLMGHIQEIRVRAGDTVRAGETVAVLDAREAETGYRQAEAAQVEARSALPEASQAVAAAQAQLELAGTTFKRMSALNESKSISEHEFDEAKARYRAASAQHEMALARQKQAEARIGQTQQAAATAALQKGYAEVKAPFAGVVLERRAEPGMLASPGMPILVIEQAGSYRLEAAVEESLLPKVRIGQRVPVTLDAFDRELNGPISEIVPALDPASRSFTVKIDLPVIPNLRSGVFGRVRFQTGQQDVVLIPAAAALRDGQVQRVLVASDGYAKGRLVTLGAQRDKGWEVLSGLTAGEAVIVPVPAGLVDGARIEVRQ